MTITKALLAGLVVVWVCIAQTNVSITGKVTDSTGVTAISGAAVRLEKGGLPTTSGTDGSFTITGTIDIITPHFNKTLSGKISASLHNGYLSLNLREKTYIEIASFTIQGKELSSLHKTLDIGSHSVALPITAAGVCFYRIKAGNEEFVLKSNSLTDISRGASLSNQGTSSPTAFTRQAMGYVPINDVIAVTKDGYLNYQMIVTKSDTSGIVIKMLPSAGTVTDIDGNVYQTVKIGNQVWTVENLRTTKYNDGSDIPLVTDSTAWLKLTTPGYCWYNNDAANKAKYGALYNWYTVNPANPKKIAPVGWHVSTDAEWTVLVKYMVLNGYNWNGTTDTLANNKIAKSLASKTDWHTYSTPGAIGNDLTTNNRSGFSALPGGYRYNDGSFNYQSYYGYWWSATESGAAYAWHRLLLYVNVDLYRYYYNKSCGFSVRLVRD